jgi:enamine deaminase RidA (YjgF/YER057c/UK114 family)
MVEITPSSYGVVGRLRKELFSGGYPASTMVEVNRLASLDWLIEIAAWAVA